MQCNVYNREDYGGFWRRWFGDALDGILLGIVFSIVSATLRTLAEILEILIFLSYMIGFKVSRGATPGYQLLGMKIVAINGTHPTVGQIAVRLISSIFSALALGLGFLWIAFDRNKQAWHDKIAGTYVIRTNAQPVQRVEIPQTGLIRVKLFASVAVASILLFVGLFGGLLYRGGIGEIFTLGGIGEILTLSRKIAERYEMNTFVSVRNGRVDIFLVNSSLNLLEGGERATKAREVAEFVRDEYPRIEEIESISICLVSQEKSGLVTYTDQVASFSFGIEEGQLELKTAAERGMCELPTGYPGAP